METISFYPDEKLRQKINKKAEKITESRLAALKTNNINQALILALVFAIVFIGINGLLSRVWYGQAVGKNITLAGMVMATIWLLASARKSGRRETKIRESFNLACQSIPSVVSPQTYHDLELLVINDDYTGRNKQKLEKTLEYCEAIIDQDPALRGVVLIIGSDAMLKLLALDSESEKTKSNRPILPD